MKIAIDISPLVTPKRTVIENFTFNFCKNLPKVDKENEYILFANSYGHFQSLRKAIEDMGIGKSRNILTHISRVPGTILELMWKYIQIPSIEYLVHEKIDVFHIMGVKNPPLRAAKLIVTIYDLIPLKFPNLFDEKTRGRFNFYFNNVIPKADIIIAISDSVKEDIIKYNISEDKVEVVFPGFDGELYRQIQDKNMIDKVKAKYGIDRKYILFVGTLEPRKNLGGLIKAYSILPDYLKSDYLLVICGKKGWFFEEIFGAVKELKVEEKVIFTGYVSDEDVSLLMNGAEVFVYPSLYEGFGLPPLEAMACGTPVISSKVSSLPEVVNDAGILVNPNDIEELSNAILRVLSSNELRVQL
jgi:glycosyltransferase involved in cell wall biosynthesis